MMNIDKSKKIRMTISFSLASAFLLGLLSFPVFFFSSCRLYKLERKLDPVNAEFLSQTRYIITRKERKIFLELPDSEKEKFKEEFWKRRDRDPETEENEFKTEYFNRIEKANELFHSEGRPGWLTDRGRIHILFGPPTYREIHTIESMDPSSFLFRRCGEVWHYGGFPVVFIDRTCTGSLYELVTYDLTALRDINMMYMHELSLAQAEAQKTFRTEKEFFDFRWKVEKTVVEAERIEGKVIFEIPYKAIWYKFEDNTLKTTLEVRLELRDFENQIIWEHDAAFAISIKEEELKDIQGERYKIEIPFVLDKDLARLRQGKNMLHSLLKNRTGGEEMKKAMEFIL